ncbi:hypothetical protein FQV37_250 [Psychrobacter nivimaris]|uniref:Uncharacterized protein n=1 Tax=Psychrobacter nivimaris TaxID=281738 RepID=A0A6N7BYL6_9GAMM|nr:hypothetical protein FQV37_250 [Psychrobacter nivimaris]
MASKTKNLSPFLAGSLTLRYIYAHFEFKLRAVSINIMPR